MDKPELLAPAGGMEQLEAALRYGADAVYVGGKSYGLRAYAGNFDSDQLREAVSFTHAQGKKLYVTLNAFLYDQDLEGMAAALAEAEQIGVDAAIVSDPAAVLLAREVAPNLPLHLSTQANTLNSLTAAHWHGLGVSRVILARELSLSAIGAMRARLPDSLALEAFVHGSACASYSGRCVLSNYMTARDANQGACAQPCRWRYQLVEEKRPGQYMPIFEDGRGTYIYAANDLCMIEHLGELARAGVRSFKIEGRMKSAYYVATVVRAYRRALSDWMAGKPFDKGLLAELNCVSHRPMGTGFFFDARPADPPGLAEYTQGATYVAKVVAILPEGLAEVEQKNKFSVGERVEALTPKDILPFAVESLWDETGECLSCAPHAGQRVRLRVPKRVRVGDLLRRPLG